MVKAIKQGAHTSAHILSQLLFYCIFCNHQYVLGSGIFLETPCSYILSLKWSVYVLYFAD